MSDTIAAVATGNLLSAIGVLRVSGPEAIAAVDRVFTPLHGGPMAERPDRFLVYGSLHDAAGAALDYCLCTVSRAPHSYTGEDTAELQCHGSPTVLRAGLEALFAAGARQAGPGEFTRRAFLNGRLDLTQAEAVADLIEAETAEAAKNAAGQLGGAIGRKTGAVYDALRDISSHFHAVIDYPDEDIPAFRLEEYAAALQSAEETLSALLRSFDRGKILTRGVPTAIVGRPNVGKSSLLNALVGYERAIVTDVPGTTRDTVEEQCVLGGVLLRLIDTAGLRETGDAVERLGVERSRAAMEKAGLIFVVLDQSRPATGEDRALIRQAVNLAPTVIVINKADLPVEMEFTDDMDLAPAMPVSAGNGDLGELAALVSGLFLRGEGEPAGEILTNARQAEAVGRALESVRAARTAIADGFTPDAVLTETEAAMAALGELTGRTVREDITNRIFERFCVGK